MSGWRPALRIARRSVRRNLKRSILVASLIAVPIAGATVVDGLLRTVTGDEYRAAQFLGDADGFVSVTDRATLPGWEPGRSDYAEMPEATPDETRDPATVDVLGLLPPGSRIVASPDSQALRLREGDRIVRSELSIFAVGDPLTAQFARMLSGRPPSSPTEAVVTEPLAERLGLLDDDQLRAGATITPDDGPTITVTGVSVHPYMTDSETAQVLPGSVLVDDKPDELKPLLNYYVDLPAGTDGDTVWPLLADHGVEFRPRAFYTEPGQYLPTSSFVDLMETAAPVVLIVVLGLLEVVLLAGAAFAVGARRQIRELGLVGANGGTARHVRRIVLAQGLFLGVIGTASGLVFGWLVLVAGTSTWEWATNNLIDGWTLGWIELSVAAAIGVASGAAAALLPAIGAARMRPVDALAQRFRNTTGTSRRPVLGMVLLGVGIGGLIVSALVARAAVRDYNAALESSTATEYPSLEVFPAMVGVLVSSLVLVAGMALAVSGLVGVLGRVGSRLPLTSRLALRDAGRHRHRTVPAIVAIMVVVTGSVTLAFSLSSTIANDYRTVPDHTILVSEDPWLADDNVEKRLAEGTTAAAAELPGAVTHEIQFVEQETDSYPFPINFGQTSISTIDCAHQSNRLGVATPELIELATGQRPDPAALTAMANGDVLITDECLIIDGEATTIPQSEGGETVSLPAHHLPQKLGDQTSFYDLPDAFVSAETARANGWTVRTISYAVVHSPDATQDQIDAAITSAEDSGLTATVETDHADEANLISLALAAGAGLVTLFGVGITVALSGAESRADLATLAAIGAQPRRRRFLAGAQALVLSLLGTATGLVFGGALGFAVVPLTGQLEVAMPWENLAVTVVVVPLLAVGVAMVSTRSRLPMVRRLD